MKESHGNLSIYLSEENSYTVSVNEDIDIVIKRNDVGYSVDVYSHKEVELFDTLTVWDEDINQD